MIYGKTASAHPSISCDILTLMEEIIVGVVGVLQFDVLKYRLENEYNVEIRMDSLPYEDVYKRQVIWVLVFPH